MKTPHSKALEKAKSGKKGGESGMADISQSRLRRIGKYGMMGKK